MDGVGVGGGLVSRPDHEADYEAEMTPLLLDEMEIGSMSSPSFHYTSDLTRDRESGEGSKDRMTRLAHEISTLNGSLPSSWHSFCALRVDEEGPEALRAMISGPTGTPYESGLFAFDILVPPQYPAKPPKCNLMTTGSGTFRFNPNLYSCGKVCLSLLGTWQGAANEAWDKEHSSLLQLLISIQSLILVEGPFFNEPSYERQQGKPEGERRNRAYSNIVRYGTIKHAMTGQLKEPAAGFEDVVRLHFRRKRESILQLVHGWLHEARQEAQLRKGEAAEYTHQIVKYHNSSLAQSFSEGKYVEMLEEAVAELEAELATLDA